MELGSSRIQGCIIRLKRHYAEENVIPSLIDTAAHQTTDECFGLD